MVFVQDPKLATVFMVMKVLPAIYRLATHLAYMGLQLSLTNVNAYQDGQVEFAMYLYAILLVGNMDIALTRKSVNATKAISQAELLQCVTRLMTTCMTRIASQA
jgi:hypothetical protein